jgi:OmcA/MtrC family decaheme c-type cytochrome
MALLHCGIVLVATSASLASSHPSDLAIHRTLHGTAPAQYTASQTEFYLTAEQIAYIRPGYHITVNGVTIGTDLKPVVDVSFTDDAGQALDRAGVQTPGTLAASFILAWYSPTGRYYTSYYTRTQTSPITGVSAVQANTASGTWEDVAIGRAKFHFTTALPATYDVTKTHTLGIYGTRTIALTDPIVLNKIYVNDVEYDFRPDGKAITDTWNKMGNAQCNRCHDPLAAHGTTGRQDVKICVMCHNPQTIDPDTGNSVDAKIFIHKLHMGSSLPSVKAGGKYQIIGFNQTVADYSTVNFPQDIRNCATCHAATSPQNFVWYTYPSRAACGSCHDDINWASGANHVAGAQSDDTACASCHPPQGNVEWDAGVQNAHVVPTKSAQLQGFKIQYTNLSNAGPGQKPIITFTLTNSKGVPVDPTKITRVSFVFGGPTTDYTTRVSENLTAANVKASGSSWIYTCATATIPATATGTWVLSGEVYNTVTLNPAPRLGPTSTRDWGTNQFLYFAVTDKTAVARRLVADTTKCFACHEQFTFHSGSRNQVQFCNVCHNPTTQDNEKPPDSWHLKWQIHKIHSGENLTLPYCIGTGNCYNDVQYPGDRRDCLACHATVASGAQQTYELPLPDTALPTLTSSNPYIQVMQPTTAACLSCHDTKAAAAHAVVNTATFGEACVICHGVGAEFAVSQVHAR